MAVAAALPATAAMATCAYADNSNCHSVLWQNGTVTDLSTLGGLQGFTASAINNLGQIAGSAPPAPAPSTGSCTATAP